MVTKTSATGRIRRIGAARVCGLCGKPGSLARTECCGNLICDGEKAYLRNGCRTRHDRFTLCGFHSSEAHAGPWQVCRECRDEFETEIFVWYGTNQWNFVKLETPRRSSRRCARPAVSAFGLEQTSTRSVRTVGGCADGAKNSRPTLEK